MHGNLPALEAVLADAGAVDGYVLGGDYALFGGWPRETVERLGTLAGALSIRGNGERWTDSPVDAPDNPVVQGAIAASRAALGDVLVGDLGALPATALRGTTLICHGSPASDVRSFLPEPADDEAELLAGVAARAAGVRPHPPPVPPPRRRRRAGQPRLGGMPFDGDPRAAYALVHDDGSVEHRRVAYDHAASAARARELGGAWGETVARRLERARMDV